MNFAFSPRITFLLLLILNTVKIFAQAPLNDECTGAINIVTDTDEYCESSNVFYNLNATQSSIACAGDADDDIWFKFTATSVRHRIRVTSNSDIRNVGLEAFSGECGNLLSIKCDNSKEDNSGYGSFELSSLVIGETYYFRTYSKESSSYGIFWICVNTPPPVPLNDEVEGALELKVGEGDDCSKSYSGNTKYPTTSLPPCSSGEGSADIWFKFKAIAANQKIVVNPGFNFSNYIIQVFSGTPGNLVSLGCFDNAPVQTMEIAQLSNLTVGTTYYFRIYTYWRDNFNENFTICINASTKLSNDDCAGAISLKTTSYTGLCYGDEKYTTQTATKSENSSLGESDDDVWFKFVATSTRHRINISSARDIYPVIELFEGNCNSLVSLSVNNGGSSFGAVDVGKLKVGETYLLRAYSKEFSVYGDFAICISSPPPPPINDDAIGAIELIVNEGDNCTNALMGETSYSTKSLAGCSGRGDFDVWYKFKPQSNEVKITLSPYNGEYTDYTMQVFSGTPENLVEVGCFNEQGSGGQEIAILKNLIKDNNYYIRVYDYHNNTSVKYILCANTATKLANDDCDGAITLVPESEPAFCYGDKVYTSIKSSPSLPDCDGAVVNDVWFKFKANFTRHRVTISTTNGSAISNFQVFEGDCDYLKLLKCEGGYDSFSSTDLTKLKKDSIYYVKVFTSGQFREADFRICVSTPLPPPSNDEASGATAVIVNNTEDCLSIVTDSTRYATESLIGCSGNADDDVWFKFTAISTHQKITVFQPNSSDYFDYIFQLFSGTPENLTPISCIDDSGYQGQEVGFFNNLVKGQTYYLRVYDKSFANLTIRFKLCISTFKGNANDEKEDAIDLDINDVASCTFINKYSTHLATESMNACAGNSDDDIWYSFVAAAEVMELTLKSEIPATSFVVEVFDTDGEMLNSLSCGTIDNSEGVTRKIYKKLLKKQRYLLRVYTYKLGSAAQFSLCLSPVIFPQKPNIMGIQPEYCKDNGTIEGSILNSNSNTTLLLFFDNTNIDLTSNNFSISTASLATGVHTIKCTSTNEAGLNVDSVKFEIQELERPEILGDSIICNNAFVSLLAPSGYQAYSWSDGSTSQEIKSNVGGEYSVKVFDGNCWSDYSNPKKLLPETLDKPILTIVKNRISSTSAYKYHWFYNNQVFGSEEQSITVEQSGNYFAVITNEAGCNISSDTITYQIVNGIEDAISKQIKVYPNPTSGKFSIDYPLSVNFLEIIVNDVHGQFFKKVKLSDTLSDIAVDELPDGIYFLTIKLNKQTIVKKISLIR